MTVSDKLNFDFDAVTTRMLVDFKRETGVSLMSLVKDGQFDLENIPEEALAGMIWLAMRMDGHPDATFDEALDIPFSRLEFSEEEEPDPTPAS